MSTDAFHLQLTDDFLAGIVRDSITIVKTLGNVTPSVNRNPTDDNDLVLQSDMLSVLNSHKSLGLPEIPPILW